MLAFLVSTKLPVTTGSIGSRVRVDGRRRRHGQQPANSGRWAL
jgi:hypothetical protein